MSPQRGGWEAMQPMLGDERADDCDSWLWSDAAIAALMMAVLVMIYLDWV